MGPAFILCSIAAYFGLLLLIAWRTARNAGNAAYFLGNRASPWFAVAFGLIGDSLSGVTFISVPGKVGSSGFDYFQVVLGYVLGYIVIAEILLPLYYRLNLTSIYGYLEERFGRHAQRTGAFFFLLSRTLGAAARLYLAVNVFQAFLFDSLRIPFAVSVGVVILLILTYTYRGGIRTLVWTDTFQSSILLLGLVLSVVAIARQLDLGPVALVERIQSSAHSQMFFWDWHAPNYFWKQFLSGACIAIVMTGLDQNMMQKNLSCRTLPDAKKNIYVFTGILVVVNLLFLSLGALLFEYAAAAGIEVPRETDQLFPLLALKHLGGFAAVVFVMGLTAATFSSADSVLTTLTTSFLVDFLGVGRRRMLPDAAVTAMRHRVHLAFAGVLFLVILGFKAMNSRAVIDVVLTLAGYTYGPLLGLFAFGLVCRVTVQDRWVPVVGGLSPLLCWLLNLKADDWLGGYRFGFELLILNGLLTFLGLWVLRERPPR